MKDKILEAAMRVYYKKGARFTMDDLAAELSMSKKTIYTVFRDKKTLLYDMVDFAFDQIKESEAAILGNNSLGIEEKLQGILSVMPENFTGIDFSEIHEMGAKYPQAYARIRQRLESGWETTLGLLKEGEEAGIFRPVNPALFQMIYDASIERFLSGDELKNYQIPYMDALNGLVNMMICGIKINGE
ncbi:MAG: TetR/AcrR family transcriptional regulator [Lachnospiraceae bacterium]|nr:TetR/AcrR family transcriptional regulator [Lachnospiraceae bacterium]